MFTVKKDDGCYTIISDDSGRAFGPFRAVYVRGAVYGDFPEGFPRTRYPIHTYALGAGDTGVFVVSRAGIEDIVGCSGSDAVSVR